MSKARSFLICAWTRLSQLKVVAMKTALDGEGHLSVMLETNTGPNSGMVGDAVTCCKKLHDHPGCSLDRHACIIRNHEASHSQRRAVSFIQYVNSDDFGLLVIQKGQFNSVKGIVNAVNLSRVSQLPTAMCYRLLFRGSRQRP